MAEQVENDLVFYFMEMKVKKTIHWIIPHFTRKLAEKAKVGEKLESLQFALVFDGHKTVWSLKCFPNGTSADARGNIGIFLTLESASMKDFTAKYKFGIVSNTGETSYVAERDREAKEFKSSSGFSKFVGHDALFELSSYWLPHSRLTIMCELSLFFDKLPEQKKIPESTNAMSDYKVMFESQALSDFKLKMNDNRVLKAHRAILSARSPVFLSMLTNNMQEAAECSVDIPDYDSQTMKELLRFVYYNEVENLDEVATDLIFAAEKYQIEPLKKVCSEHILSKLELDNVVDLLGLFDRITGMETLFKKCAEFAISHHDVLSKTAGWKTLSADILSRILAVSIEIRSIEVIHV